MAYNRQNKSKYNKKSVHYATPKRGAKASKPQKQQYRKYYHEQPSKRFVYVEEPDSEGDESEDVVIEKDEVDGDFVSSEEDSEEDLDSTQTLPQKKRKKFMSLSLDLKTLLKRIVLTLILNSLMLVMLNQSQTKMNIMSV